MARRGAGNAEAKAGIFLSELSPSACKFCFQAMPQRHKVTKNTKRLRVTPRLQVALWHFLIHITVPLTIIGVFYV